MTFRIWQRHKMSGTLHAIDATDADEGVIPTRYYTRCRPIKGFPGGDTFGLAVHQISSDDPIRLDQCYACFRQARKIDHAGKADTP